MHAEVEFPAAAILAFAMVLARMAGLFAFVPLPSSGAGPSAARIFLAVACTIALFPCWPTLSAIWVDVGSVAMLLISELALGVSIGLMVGFVAEAFTFGAQVLSFQAGYAYATAVDPTSEADSDVLPVVAQLMSGLLFLLTGLHRVVIKIFAESLQRYPPGTFISNRGFAQSVIELGSGIFSVGLRLSLPVIGLLLMSEVAVGLVGRINSHLHLAQQATSAKMLITLATLASVLVAVPALYESWAAEVLLSIRKSFGH